MSAANHVSQLGFLSRDPEIRHTKTGTPVLNCCIATNRSVPKGDKFEDETTFVDFTMWGKRAEAFAKYHKKGSKAFIVGRLTTEEWKDRDTGGKRQRLKVTAEEWEFVGKDESRSKQAPAQTDDDDTPF